VGDEDDRAAGLPPDLHQLVLHHAAVLRVERAERLVHQQDLRLDRQRAGDRGPLLHPAGQAARIVALEPVQADQVEVRPGARLRRFALHAERLQAADDVVPDRLPGQQPRLLEDRPDPVLVLGGQVDRLAVDQHRPDVRPLQPGQDPQQGRLPAAVRPEQADKIAGRHLQAQVLEDWDLVALREAPDLEPDPPRLPRAVPDRLRLHGRHLTPGWLWSSARGPRRGPVAPV
jgi:hypothetical protein